MTMGLAFAIPPIDKLHAPRSAYCQIWLWTNVLRCSARLLLATSEGHELMQELKLTGTTI